MQMSMEGMRVRKVIRMTMVHCEDPPAKPVIRNSFGFEGALSWMGAAANSKGSDGPSATPRLSAAPARSGLATASAQFALRQSMMQSIARAIRGFLKRSTPVLLSIWNFASRRDSSAAYRQT